MLAFLPLLLATCSLPLFATAAPAQHLEARGSSCHNNEEVLVRSGTSFICLGNKVYWRGAAISAIGATTVSNVASVMTNWVSSHAVGAWDTQSGRKRRSVGGVDSDTNTTVLTVGAQSTVVPYETVGDRIVIDISAFLNAGSSLGKRDDADEVAPLVGGSASYFLDGTLDTCTLDWAISETTYAEPTESDSPSTTVSTETLAKRSYWSLHTSYWAAYSHETTKLNWNEIYSIATASYRSLPNGVSQVCGYMANSGTWHGAFRHWTGDNGQQVGECSPERVY